MNEESGGSSQMIQLRSVVAAVLKIMRKTLNMKDFNPTFPKSRYSLMKNIYFCKIIVARCITLFRFLHSPQYKNVIKNRKLIENDLNIIERFDYKQLIKRTHEDIKNSYQKPKFHNFFSVPPNLKVRNTFQQFNDFFANVIHSDKRIIKVMGNCIRIVHKDHFGFMIQKTKDNKYKFKNLTIFVPEDANRDITTNVKYIIALINKYLASPSTALEKLENLFYSIIGSCVLWKICKELIPLQDLYHFRLYRKNNSIYLTFGDKFYERGSFSLLYLRGNFIIRSAAPVYIPYPSQDLKMVIPQSMFATPHTFLSFDNLRLLAEHFSENVKIEDDLNFNDSKAHMFLASLPPSFCSMPFDIISFIRKIVIYTQLRTAWDPLMKIIAMNKMLFLAPRIAFDTNIPTLSSIIFFHTLHHQQLLASITIDQVTGEIMLSSDQLSISVHNIILYRLHSLFSTILFQFLFSHFMKGFRIELRIPKDTNIDFPCATIGVSYAKHFEVCFQSMSIPRITVLDKNGKSHVCQEILTFNNLKNYDAWQYMPLARDAIMSFLFILELQSIFEKKGHKPQLLNNMLIVQDYEFICAIIKTTDLQWKMKIMLNVNAFLQNHFIGKFVFTGNILNSRSPQCVFNICDQFHSMVCMSKFTVFSSLQNPILSRMEFRYSQNSILLSSQISLPEKPMFNIHYDNLEIFANIPKKCTYITVSNNQPKCFMSLNTKNAVSYALRNLDITQISALKFQGFIAHSLIPILKTLYKAELEGWQMIAWTSPSVFQLIYMKKYTLTIELKPFHYFFICLSSELPNGAMIIPIISQAAVAQNAPMRHAYRTKYHMKDFFNAIKNIENFIKRFEDAINAGYTPIKLEIHPIPKVLLSFYNLTCSLEARKTNLTITGDQRVNDALINMPKTIDTLRLMTLLINRHSLMILLARVLTVLNNINKDVFDTAAATAFFEGNKVHININGFPFQLNGNTATCGELVFRGDSMDEIQNALMTIV